MAAVQKRASKAWAFALLLATMPRTAVAEDPDPVNAVLLSTGSTLVPLGIATGLLATGRGKSEGIRFDVAMAFTGIGSVIGPSVGQFYARGGTNAWVTLGLRLATSATMTTGLALRLRGGEGDRDLGTALFWVGLVPTALLGLYDIITAYGTAKDTKYRGAVVRQSSGLTPELLNVAVCGPVPCEVNLR